MYVCVCNGVTDRDIHAAVDDGVATFKQLSRKLGVGTCCGRCCDCARRELERARGQHVALEPGLVPA